MCQESEGSRSPICRNSGSPSGFSFECSYDDGFRLTISTIMPAEAKSLTEWQLSAHVGARRGEEDEKKIPEGRDLPSSKMFGVSVKL